MLRCTNMPRIVKDPEVLCGKATIEGTRISVEQVLGMLAAGAPFEEVIVSFPYLTREDILACLRYAAEILVQSEHQIKVSPSPETHRLAS